MKIAIMQPYFMPYIGYFQLINSVDKFVIYDDVSYINRGWINRNRILVNQEPFMLTIPLVKASQNKLINEIYICNKSLWRSKFLRTVEFAYKKSPFFNDVFPVIEEIVNSEFVSVAEYIVSSLQMVCDFLDIKTVIVSSSSCYNNNHKCGPERILDICLQENSKIYINPIGGVELYDPSLFINNKVDLKFLKTNSIEYKQFKGGFVPCLSIIDVLMFNAPSEVNRLLSEHRMM